MRRSVRDQLPLVPAPFGHVHVRELAAMRVILDAHPEFARWVQSDLLAGGVAPDQGRNGMSGVQVLRALVIKQANGFSYEQLAFHLADSQSYRAFCLIGFVVLADKVLDQTRRRVLDGETVPAPQKIVSIFEPHTDIIRKDRRDTLYGHKVFLTAARQG